MCCWWMPAGRRTDETAEEKSSTLGLVITTLVNPFYAESTQAIIDLAKEDCYGVIASSVDNGIV